MKNEKWNYNGVEVDIPIVSEADIERNIDINLEDTMDLSSNAIKDRFEETMELKLEDAGKIDTIGEDSYE